jgi:hypothetical protein
LRQFGDFFAAKGGTPGSILLIGEDGMGKGTLASAFANALDAPLQTIDSSLLIRGDFTAAVTNLRENQVLFVENIQFLKKPIRKLLQSVLRTSKLSIFLGVGSSGREHVIDVRPFTCIGACHNKSDCPTALLSLFSLQLTLHPYSRAELQEIAAIIANKMGVNLEQNAASLIARHCDGRPADVESILLRLVRAINKITICEQDTLQAFAAFGISVQPLQLSDSPTTGPNFEELSGVEFEKLIASLLVRMGFRTELTSTTGDGGIDVIATLDKAIVGGKYLFQCKRFGPDSLVGAPTVRDFYGAVTADRAVKGVFITTSDFTAQAREFGERVGLELINLKGLRQLLSENEIES